MIPNRFSVLACHDRPKWEGAYFKEWDEFTVELKESNKAGNISHQFRFRPIMQELMFRHCGAVTVNGNVDSNKFESLWEKMALF